MTENRIAEDVEHVVSIVGDGEGVDEGIKVYCDYGE